MAPKALRGAPLLFPSLHRDINMPAGMEYPAPRAARWPHPASPRFYPSCLRPVPLNPCSPPRTELATTTPSTTSSTAVREPSSCPFAIGSGQQAIHAVHNTAHHARRALIRRLAAEKATVGDWWLADCGLRLSCVVGHDAAPDRRAMFAAAKAMLVHVSVWWGKARVG